MTRCARPPFRLQSQKVKVTRSLTYQQQQRDNSAVDGRINFKLDGSYHRGRGAKRVTRTFQVSRSNKPEAEIWRNGKRPT